MAGLATIVVLFVTGVLIMVGAIVLGSTASRRCEKRSADEPRPQVCQCGRPNSPDARYCARCGKAFRQ